MICNTAIFYDIENLMGLFSGKTNTMLHLDEIKHKVQELDGVNGISVQRAYADWSIVYHRYLRNSVLQLGIEPIQIFNTNQNDKVKNAADVSLIIDAVDLISARPEIENFVIASGDGIFAFLAKKLHEHGKRVIGCGYTKISNVIFQNACDFYVFLEKADTSAAGKSPHERRKVTPSETVIVEPVPPPPPPPPKVSKLPGRFPKSKYSEALVQANLTKLNEGSNSAACFHHVRHLLDALFVESTGDMPGLEVSVFVTYLGFYLPRFKVTQHGFKRVGEFMRFMTTGSPYCIYSVADNVLLIAPRTRAKGNIMEDIESLSITTTKGDKYSSVFSVPDGEPFVFTIAPPEKAKPMDRRSRKPVPAASAVPEEPTVTEDATERGVEVEGSIRKWIKTRFESLSEADALPIAEVRRLTTTEHSQATFGIRTPIFREIETRANINEQRSANGKIKYWKESFRFNGRTYIIYKEWVASLHKDRFVAWLAAFKH